MKKLVLASGLGLALATALVVQPASATGATRAPQAPKAPKAPKVAATVAASAPTLTAKPIGGSYVKADGTAVVANDTIVIQRQQGTLWVTAAYLRASGTTFTMTGVQSTQVATYRAVEGASISAPVTVDLADAPKPLLTVQPTGGSAVLATGTSVVADDSVAIQRLQGTSWVTAGVVRATGTSFSMSGVQSSQVATYRAVEGTYLSDPVTVDLADAPAPGPTSPTTSATSTEVPCGGDVSRGDGTSWTCTFDDEFDGSSLDRDKWVAQTDFATGSSPFACYQDDPDNIAVGDGALHLTVRKEDQASPCHARMGATTSYSAGMVSTYHLFSQQYGRFEARMRQTTTGTPGLHDAFWLWPDDRYSTINWPDSGEIDIAELYSNYPSAEVPFLHYSQDHQGIVYGLNTSNTCTIDPREYNTYTMEWSPTRIEIFVNGKSCLVNTSGDPAFQKRYGIALTAGLGDGANALTPDTPIPATLDVDYVRVWS